MRIFEITTNVDEEIPNGEDTVIGRTVAWIKEQCSEFITEMGGWEVVLDNPLWRGSFDITDDIQIVTPRKDRLPRNTNRIVQQLYDNWFVEHTEIAWRSSGVFATGGVSEASGYGGLHVFMPIGEYRYCWSPKYKDLFNEGPPLSQFTEIPAEDLPELTNTVNTLLAKGRYNFDCNLLQGVESKHEVMFVCEKYLMIRKHMFEIIREIQ